MRVDPTVEPLFRPFQHNLLQLRNRIVMAPMTRAFSPNGVPDSNVAAYYRRRAEGGVGLIITEGTWIPHPSASNDPHVPRFHGHDALGGWAEVCRQVHAAGARIIPQLWHVGAALKSDVSEIYSERGKQDLTGLGPSGFVRKGVPSGLIMTQKDIDAVGESYVNGAKDAQRLGFDGIELHGAHGYLIDQFFWHETNQRADHYGGNVTQRTRFASDIIRAIRRGTDAMFPILLRFSQWKMQDYAARPWPTPKELENFLVPLVDAGVDIFDCSQRRYWEAEFAGSDLNLAGWTRKITGKPAISVGSVTLSAEMISTLMQGENALPVGLSDLITRLRRSEFDLIAIGRALISNPDWPAKIAGGKVAELLPFSAELLAKLI